MLADALIKPSDVDESSTISSYLSRIIARSNAITIYAANRIKTFVTTSTTDHQSEFYYVWLWIISVAFIYNAIFIPIRASFVDFNADHYLLWMTLDYLLADIVYIVDMFIRARTRFFQQGIAVENVQLLQRHYLKSNEFVYDALSILPTDIMFIGVEYTNHAAVRLNRLLRYRRMFEMITQVEIMTAFPNVFRFATTVFAVLWIILYVAIFYNSLSKGFGYGATDDTFQLSQQVSDLPFITRFSKCFFWATLTLCFIGEMPEANYPFERLIQIAIWILGLTVFGVIVGRLDEILDNVSAADDAFNSQLNSVHKYFHYENVPKAITQKVTKWFYYANDNNVLGSSEKVLKPLPNKLKAELAIDMHLASLKKVLLFADLESGVLMELVVRFKLQVYSPGDFVCRKGDIGREMYVVRKGTLEVVSDDGSKIFVTLATGSVFGEISLLSIPGSKTGNRRTANVRSKGYSDLFSLSKNDLYSVLEDYPGAMQKLVDKGTFILRKENKLDEEAVKMQEEQELIFKQRSEALETAIKNTENTIALLISTISRSQHAAAKRLDVIETKVLERNNHNATASAPPPIPEEGPIVAAVTENRQTKQAWTNQSGQSIDETAEGKSNIASRAKSPVEPTVAKKKKKKKKKDLDAAMLASHYSKSEPPPTPNTPRTVSRHHATSSVLLPGQGEMPTVMLSAPTPPAFHRARTPDTFSRKIDENNDSDDF